MSGVDEAAVEVVGRRFVPLAEPAQRDRAVCRSKVVYEHPRDAHEAAMEINIREGWAKPVAGYQCRECKRWHLTSKANTTRRRRWRKQMRKAGLTPATPTDHQSQPAGGGSEET